MKKHTLILSLILISLMSNISAQEEKQKEVKQQEKGSMGYGFGQDHGGLGVKFTVYPQKYVGFFGGVGWAMADISYNAGIQLRYAENIEEADLYGYFMGMYGYNAVIAIKNGNRFNKIYYGPSIGLGANLKVGHSKKNALTFAVIYPFRSPNVQKYITSLEDNHGVVFKSKLFPVTFSIGLSVPF